MLDAIPVMQSTASEPWRKIEIYMLLMVPSGEQLGRKGSMV